MDSTIYDKVFEGDVDCIDLEDVFRLFNTEYAEGYAGRSLSVSDVVELFAEDGSSTFHFCDSFGFQKIAFEPTREIGEVQGNKEMIELGTFEMTGPVMRISDPSYTKGAWCCGCVSDCKTGTWEAAIFHVEGEWGDRVAMLVARHRDTGPAFEKARSIQALRGIEPWTECSFEVGVDSGQAGFFDDVHYQDNTVFDRMPPAGFQYGDAWYAHCCDLTLSPIGAGVLPYGAVASSGYGDGSYIAAVHKSTGGETDAVFIRFID